jgi:hypothetical protein
MNIDTIINSLPSENIFKIQDINPQIESINNIFIENSMSKDFERNNIKAVKYNKQFIVDIMDESRLFTNSSDIYTHYIYCNYNKNIDDIIANISCNYKFNIVFENSQILADITSNNFILKSFLQKFPLLEDYLNKSYIFSENTIPVMLPILFMINIRIKFQVFFNSMEEYSKSKIEFKYDCYTLSNEYLKELNCIYKEHKFISNDRGMIFKNGILKHDFDLD